MLPLVRSLGYPLSAMQMDTIAAISTPAGVGAIGVVRISGPDAKGVLKRVWISEAHPVDKFVTHRMYYGKISTGSNPPLPPFSASGGKGGSGGIIDNVLAVLMAAPHSYTGEDVVEIHCHGGTLVTGKVLEAVLAAGSRPAEPGEFTRRAFMNGRMDLAQAEGVADVISASNERALRLAEEQLAGRFSNAIHKSQEELKGIKAYVEAAIDFPEEDITVLEAEGIGEKISAVINRISSLVSTYKEGRLIRDGVRVVIVGRPNVGKSSILNALVGAERAIVHHTPGTTRDTIEDAIQLGGIVFRLIDTAGLHDSTCEVEKLGIERAKIKLSEADIAIVVLDATSPLDAGDGEIIEMTSEMKQVIVLNKKDLLKIDRDEETFDFDKATKKVATSAVTGEGVDSLKSALLSLVVHEATSDGGDVVITNLRHKVALEEAVSALKDACAAALGKESAEFVAHHLQLAMNALGKITGEVTTEDMLNEIFSRFCIGK